jgi:dihydroneopterin aldolase
MAHQLQIRNIHTHSFHGCLPEEKIIGGRFTVHITFTGDFSAAIQFDQLAHAVDYVKVHQVVREEMAIPSALIEHVAGRMLRRLKSVFPDVQTVKVEVVKYNPPVNGQLGEAIFVMEE